MDGTAKPGAVREERLTCDDVVIKFDVPLVDFGAVLYIPVSR